MKRLMIVAVVAALLAPSAGCNCMNMFRRQSCGTPPPPPVQQGCADGYAAPYGGASYGGMAPGVVYDQIGPQ